MANNTSESTNVGKGIVGIQNMGNTCYCNSTLQLIRACPEWNIFCFTHDFEEEFGETTDPNKKILLAYYDILKSLWSAHRPAYVRPLGFISEVRKAVQNTVYESFGFPVPNDSHEYLVYLLDHFHEALKVERVYTEILLAEGDSATEKMQKMAANGWNKFVSANDSKVVDLFFGMMRKTIQCGNCANRTYRWEVFNSIKIPCDGLTFQDWIRNEVQEVAEIEGFRCDGCKEKCTARIYSHIWRLPPCLFITIRRFQPNGSKNMTMCPYTGENISFGEFFADEVHAEEKIHSYELRSISDHHGTHLGGHYTAQFKHPVSLEWWWFDDESSRHMMGPQFSMSNYIMLFLRR
jgi:ubiquitin C-terminal hydrolase